MLMKLKPCLINHPHIKDDLHYSEHKKNVALYFLYSIIPEHSQKQTNTSGFDNTLSKSNIQGQVFQKTCWLLWILSYSYIAILWQNETTVKWLKLDSDATNTDIMQCKIRWEYFPYKVSYTPSFKTKTMKC